MQNSDSSNFWSHKSGLKSGGRESQNAHIIPEKFLNEKLPTTQLTQCADSQSTFCKEALMFLLTE